jgi:hypothetical protein
VATHLFGTINFATDVQPSPGWEILHADDNPPYPVGLHTAQARKDAAQSTTSTSSAGVAVTELDVELRHNATYTFEYNLIYSVSGFLVGAQFGVELSAGDLVSIGYSVMIAADTSLKSVSSVVEGTLIGAGSSWSGGGPWSCNITGALKTGNSPTAVARLLMRGQGSGVTLTVQPNSSAFFMEV